MRDYRDIRPDTWSAIDGLGRVVPMHEDVGPRRDGKIVGIFYFTWQGPHGYDRNHNPAADDFEQAPLPKKPGEKFRTPFNLMEMIAANPEKPEFGPHGWWHYWGEPQWGYYLSDDEWVIRRNAQMLADAGVDVIFFDTTNGFTYLHTVKTICRIYEEMRAAGERTPQIAFMAYNNHVRATTDAYNHFHKPGLHRELWFEWKGKPLILTQAKDLPQEIMDFYTIRESWAWSHAPWFGDGKDKWPWLDDHPQEYGWEDDPSVPVFAGAAVASHPTRNRGRSFHDGKQPPRDQARPELGLHFQEQVERVLEIDPQVFFITGWNEWVALHFPAERPMQMLGKQIQPGESFFVDLYDEEYNRDIEPMRGGHGDATYYQMVSAIRRFKGAAPVEPAGPRARVADGDWAAWDAVEPAFLDHVGDTVHRDHPGWGSAGPYVNKTGRNDIVEARVARDGDVVQFMAKCAEPLTKAEDGTWMRVFIRDANAPEGTPHWEGYHFVVQPDVANRRFIVGRCKGGWEWEVAGEAQAVVSGDKVVYTVERALLGLDKAGPVELHFKWTDNVPLAPRAVDFNDHGDCAPDGRFNFVFRAED